MFKSFTLNIGGHLRLVDRPLVMAILNVTPDSFYHESRMAGTDLRAAVRKLVDSGADIIDIGACSTRPGSNPPTPDEELTRLRPALEAARDVAPHIPVSVDTYRAEVAKVAVLDYGASIINDISGGDLDPAMFGTIASLGTPYIIMHMRGTPATMQEYTDYQDVTAEVIHSLSVKLRTLRLMGVSDVIADPGFGFAKTMDQNFQLLRDLSEINRQLDAPLLVGVSRKSMITRLLEIPPADALPATVAVNTLALTRGASILRVHDPSEASQAVRIYMQSTFQSPA